MKRYFSAQSFTKGNQKQSKLTDEASSNERSDLSTSSGVKRSKNRSSPDLKWMDNRNDAYKKYIAFSTYSDLYQLIDFHKNNSEVMKLYDTLKALQLSSLLSKEQLQLYT
ncbi:8695_t:CDS:2 [Funneliformis caledonium]|uniref:8695_t:CDS:1 n=1 Tax=Funneliformis caledonium TaxID=1117310 RepID=A0A9N8YT35_9GLOM|nr:8695_t:CDS:2 [Funneliformis caledonium]